MRTLLACLALCGCAGDFGSPYSWDATQANRQNIAASAERPWDLVLGRGAEGGDGAVAAQAIERFRQGRPRPLPGLATTTLQTAADSPAAPASDAAASGGKGPAAAPASAATN